jgi:hypothetical protein
MTGARWIETDTLSDHDLSSAHEVGSYTADADRLIAVQLFLDDVAGDDDYLWWATLQIAGSGSAYKFLPATTAAAASGETAIGGQSILIGVKDDDVLKVYVDCIAADSSVDAYVRFFEVSALQPATADRTVVVDAAGLVDTNAVKVGPTGSGTAQTAGDIKASITALNNISKAEVNAEVVDVLRTDLIPDSYAADGDQPTFAQAVLAIQQYLFERAVSSTTVTVKKPDGAATAMTFTLNDGTNPTSVTRAS